MEKPTEQEIQESQYDLPYHWFLKPNEYRGRKYFGYTNAAVDFAIKHGLDIRHARILDAGCGDGRLIKLLRDRGANNVSGMDYSEKAMRFAKVLLPNTTFYNGDLTRIDSLENTGKYDAIFLIETLEHIPTDCVELVLSNLNKLLNDKGLIVISVPSILLPMHDKHYQHFSSTSLKKPIGKYFEILEIAGYSAKNKVLLRLAYKIFDNRVWRIHHLSKWFNMRVWPKYLNLCEPDKGEGLLLVGKKHVEKGI